MRSTMTEREFLARFQFRRKRGLEGELIALQIAKEAGLEFAPEPVKLPERLECGSSAHQAVDLWPVPGTWGTFEARLAGYKAAADRYNAYPGLRAAAEALLEAVRVTFDIGAIAKSLDDTADELRAELAKGPKP